jgi:hypothetical protein
VRLDGPQPEPGGGDDPERSLTAGQQLGQVVSGVVRSYAAQARDDTAIGQYRFDPEKLGPGPAVADGIQAARVGGDGPADGRRVAGGEADPVFEPRRRRV